MLTRTCRFHPLRVQVELDLTIGGFSFHPYEVYAMSAEVRLSPDALAGLLVAAAVAAVLVFVLVYGGGVPASAPRPEIAVEVQPPTGQPPTGHPEAPRPRAKATYEGRTAEEWGRELLEGDSLRANRAANALTHMGDEGIPYLVRALGSDGPGRGAALGCLTTRVDPDRLTTAQGEYFEALRGLLSDADKDTRSAASRRWGDCAKLACRSRAQAALPKLRELAAKDPAPHVRNQAAAAMRALEGAAKP
jgi:hypothetical protein